MHFANAWSIALADDDAELCEAFRAGQNYPDGKPVVWAMRWMLSGKSAIRPTRVDGPTFFERVLEQGVARHVTHYFLGSTPDTLQMLISNVQSRFPGVEVVGSSSPPFKELDFDDFEDELSKIKEVTPHIIWVGLGTPKQDRAAAYLATRYSGVFACVGAAFDYTAGNLRVAPKWIQEAGLGWLLRFVQEPRRLWRRYVYGNTKFIRIVVGQLFAKRITIDRHKGGT